MATLAFATLRGAEPSSLRSCPPCQLLQFAMRGFPSLEPFLRVGRSGPSRDCHDGGGVVAWRRARPGGRNDCLARCRLLRSQVSTDQRDFRVLPLNRVLASSDLSRRGRVNDRAPLATYSRVQYTAGRLGAAGSYGCSRQAEMATFTKEVLKEGNGPTPQVGQNVTVEANLYLAKDMTAIWCAAAFVLCSRFAGSAACRPHTLDGASCGWPDSLPVRLARSVWRWLAGPRTKDQVSCSLPTRSSRSPTQAAPAALSKAGMMELEP